VSVHQFLARRRQRKWLRGCARVGTGIQLHGRPEVHLDGGTVLFGDRCAISSQPVTTHFVAGPSAVLDIRSEVSIGHGGAIAAYERIEIGEGTSIGPFAIIMDTNFHGNSGDQAVHHDCRPVIIGVNCRIGSRVTITRGARIGDGAEILAGSVVSSTIPPGACAGGARARVLGEAGERGPRWDSAAAVLPLIVMDCLDLDSPPDSKCRPADLSEWNGATAEVIVRALESRFGLPITAAQLQDGSSLAELAVWIDEAIRLNARGEAAHG